MANKIKAKKPEAPKARTIKAEAPKIVDEKATVEIKAEKPKTVKKKTAKRKASKAQNEIKKLKAEIKELQPTCKPDAVAGNITKEALKSVIEKSWIPTLESCKEMSHLRSMKIKRELKSIIRRV